MIRLDDCIYKDVCELSDCRSACMRYREMKYMLDFSNIPKSKQKFNVLVPEKCDLQAFTKLSNIRDDIVNFVNSGKNIYLYSKNCGNGKTTWAIKLMLQYFNDVWVGNGFKERGIFIHVPTFLYDSKMNISHRNEKFEHLQQMLPKVDLVIWDDIISSDVISNYDFNTLLVLLDQRNLNEQSNIFTSNLVPNDLVSIAGNKISSRISNDVIQIELKGADRRYGTTSNTEQNIKYKGYFNSKRL